MVLIWLMSNRDDDWIFYAVVILAPLGLIAIRRPEQLYVRYFMISVATSLVLLPSGYEALLRRGLAGLGVALALLAIFVAETPPRLLIYFDLVAASTSPLSISWK